MKNFLKNLDGYHRIAIALSGVWLIVANLLYFSGLGGVHVFSFNTPESSTDYATWRVLWSFFTSNLEVASPYITKSSRELNFQSASWVDEYSLSGHLVFMFLPVFCIWAVFAVMRWVRAGFNNKV